jgi:vacuolar-type H+-ATPase subunit H
MESIPNLSQEELEAILEKAKRELQEKLDKMTPEERKQAQLRAQKMIEEDQAENQKLLEDAAKYVSPRFCQNCGAPASGGKFCTYCGSPL